MSLSVCSDEIIVHRDEVSMEVWSSARVILSMQAGSAPPGAYWITVDPTLHLAVYALDVTIHGPLDLSGSPGKGAGSEKAGGKGRDVTIVTRSITPEANGAGE